MALNFRGQEQESALPDAFTQPLKGIVLLLLEERFRRLAMPSFGVALLTPATSDFWSTAAGSEIRAYCANVSPYDLSIGSILHLNENMKNAGTTTTKDTVGLAKRAPSNNLQDC